ncbi:histidine kinase [Sphingobacterium sp. WM]|uniref:histidine kinase n=1 Tax=Sphingobacterium sp. WM TaxID=3031802 RepID=UPI00240DAB00|nr:histidine kinase [Sphingobacterium sp. WM]WFB63264.1 histidine kinase [Sphingobacterium sp. WM]
MKQKRFLWHAGAWTLYGIYFFIVNALGNNDLRVITVLYTLPIFMLVYYGISFALNNLLFNRKYFFALLMAIGVYVLVWVLVYQLTQPQSLFAWIYKDYRTSANVFELRMFIQTYLKLVGNFTILALLKYQFKLRGIWEKRESQERSNRRKYEYTALAQQIPSHLLANAFQSLEGQFALVFPQMRHDLLQMYSLMNHFMISNNPQGPKTIILADEIKAAKQFIAIQKGFSGYSDEIMWKIKGDTETVTIPSTTLITLVSNVFKHGGVSDVQSHALIDIWVSKDEYIIQVENPLPKQGESKTKSHGIGLVNLKARLEFVFGDNVEFSHGATWGTYSVYIKVKL